ncbi:hypothetical protein F4678DRAFT_181193 [Xylaria arbuscula]|nr:hypothetical protein F4678DRAFT_181193 [Xylaria arbuscula]
MIRPLHCTCASTFIHIYSVYPPYSPPHMPYICLSTYLPTHPLRPAFAALWRSGHWRCLAGPPSSQSRHPIQVPSVSHGLLHAILSHTALLCTIMTVCRAVLCVLVFCLMACPVPPCPLAHLQPSVTAHYHLPRQAASFTVTAPVVTYLERRGWVDGPQCRYAEM